MSGERLKVNGERLKVNGEQLKVNGERLKVKVFYPPPPSYGLVPPVSGGQRKVKG